MAKSTIVLKADGSDIIKTVNQINQSLKSMSNAAQQQASLTNKALKRIGDAAKYASAGLKTLGAGLLITATGGGLQSITRTADAFKQLTARVTLASEGLGDASKNYAELSKQAQASGTYLETTVSVFQRMAMVAPSLGATNDEILRVTDTVQKLSVITGAGSEQMKYGLTQLGQAFGQTYIMAEEFNSLNENIPGVLKAVADQMGMTTAELRNMQREGKLASKDFFEALLASAAKADEAFTKMPVTIERATNSIRISFSNLVGKLDEASNATGFMADSFMFLSKAMDYAAEPIADTIRVVGSLGGVIVDATLGVASGLTTIVGGFATAIALMVNGVLKGINTVYNAVANLLKFLPKANLNINGVVKGIAGATGVSQDFSSESFRSMGRNFNNMLHRPAFKGPSAFVPPPMPRIGGGSRGGGFGGRRPSAPSRSSSGSSPRATTKEQKPFVAERIDPLTDYMKDLFQRSQGIIESLKTPFDVFNDQVAELDLLAKHNLLTFDQFNAKLAEYRQELDATLPKTEALTGSWEEYANAASQATNTLSDLQQITVNVGTEFANMVASGTLNFSTLASSLIRDIARVIIQLKVVTPLMNSLFGAQGQGGGLFSRIGAFLGTAAKGFSLPTIRGLPTGGGGAPIPPLPGFANGGLPPVGRPVMVGERGPELVTFGQQARVHSNSDTRAMLAGGSNVTVNVIGAPEGTKVRESQAGGQRMIDVIIGQVASQISSGQGAIPKAMSSRYGVNPSRGLA